MKSGHNRIGTTRSNVFPTARLRVILAKSMGPGQPLRATIRHRATPSVRGTKRRLESACFAVIFQPVTAARLDSIC